MILNTKEKEMKKIIFLVISVFSVSYLAQAGVLDRSKINAGTAPSNNSRIKVKSKANLVLTSLRHGPKEYENGCGQVCNKVTHDLGIRTVGTCGLHFTIKNLGGTDARSSRALLSYLDWKGNFRKIGVYVGKVKAGKTYHGNIKDSTIGWFSNKRALFFKLDYKNIIDESNENDNSRSLRL